MKIHDNILDIALQEVIDNVTALHICSSDPADYAATLTASLGNKAAPTINAPENGSVDGRQIVIPDVTDGSTTATGTATHFALIDSVNSLLLASGTLSAGVSVTSGQTFTLAEFSITFRDPA